MFYAEQDGTAYVRNEVRVEEKGEKFQLAESTPKYS